MQLAGAGRLPPAPLAGGRVGAGNDGSGDVHSEVSISIDAVLSAR
jgi:hypothetical protein